MLLGVGCKTSAHVDAAASTSNTDSPESSMKAWLLAATTGIEQLRLAEIPDPVPAAGQVILRVHFAALNPADRYLAEGQYPARPTFPHILGRDGFGEVIAVGPGVTDIKVGDRKTV